MSIKKFDFCGIWSNLDMIRQKTELPIFSSWWKQTLEYVRNAEHPSMETASFAYAITGDDDLGKKAIRIFRETLPGYIPLGGAKEYYPELEADLSTASACKALAYTYNFLYPLLNVEDKQALFYELRQRGGGVIYKETLSGAWWGNSPNSNWNSHLQSGLGLSGLVLMEDDEKEAKKWIDEAIKTMVAMLDLAGEEGTGIEGPGYWGFCYRSVQELVEALKNANIIDLYNHKFWDSCTNFPLYMCRPDMSGLINFSDTGYSGIGSSHFFYAVATRKRHGLAQWFGDRILERSSPSIWDLIYYDPEIKPISPENLPTDKFFKSIHVANFRSGWDKDAVFFILKGGSNAWSHCHLDLNSIFIDAYGERLVVDPGPDQYSLHYFTSIEPALSTSWHNTIVVDGADQRQPPRYRMNFDLEEGGDAYCRLSEFAADEQVAMIKGDATTAYGDYLEKFHRDVVYLKPDCFVIFDDIRLKEARTQRHLQWLLHSELPMIDNNDGTIQIQGEKAKLVIHPIFPLKHDYKFPPKRILMKDKDKGFNCFSLRPKWHHLWNVSPSRSPYPQWDPRSKGILYGRDIQFLVVLSAMRYDEPYGKIIKPIMTQNIYGIEITSGNKTDQVYFNPNGLVFDVFGEKFNDRKLVIRQNENYV